LFFFYNNSILNRGAVAYSAATLFPSQTDSNFNSKSYNENRDVIISTTMVCSFSFMFEKWSLMVRFW